LRLAISVEFMTVPQITIRLFPEEKEAFETYAQRFGLNCSDVAKLLISREQKLRRLRGLKRTQKLPARTRQDRGFAVAKDKITAHLRSVEEVQQFDEYAVSCGLSRDGAGAWLLQTELREKWLQRALQMR
jgi:hypothetical protein